MASRKNELELVFSVCVHNVSFTCELGTIIMMEITDCISLICFIIICIFVLEYEVCFAIFAFLEVPRCLVIQDCENTKDLAQAVCES